MEALEIRRGVVISHHCFAHMLWGRYQRMDSMIPEPYFMSSSADDSHYVVEAGVTRRVSDSIWEIKRETIRHFCGGKL